MHPLSAKIYIFIDLNVQMCKAGMLSPDGRCKTFSSAADGYGRAEGCGLIVLKRLSDAIANKYVTVEPF